MNKRKERVEKQLHRDAFDIYVKMGDKRNLEELSKEFRGGKYKVRTLRQWSSDFKWRERIQKIEEEETKKALEKTKKDIQKRKVNSINFLISYLQKMEVAMMTEKRDMYYSKDYSEMLKMLLLLNQEATERTENTNNNTNINTLTEEDKELIKNLEASIAGKIAGVKEGKVK